MASNAAITPAEKKRQNLFKQMTAETQKVVTEFQGRVQKANTGTVLLQYDLGAHVADMVSEEAKYGSGAVKLVAEYFGSDEPTMYNLRTFAAEFERDYVKELSGREMANGKMLSVGHWMQVMKLKEKDAQKKMLEKVFKNSMTVGDLELEIRTSGQQRNARAGGRKAKVPSSAIIGLQKSWSLLNAFNNYESQVIEKSVLGAIDKMGEDDVTDTLLEKLTLTQETAKSTAEKAKALYTELTTRIKDVKTKLAEKAKHAPEPEAAAPSKPKGSKNKKGKKGRKAAASA